MGRVARIRPGTPADAEAAAEIAVLAWEPTYESRRELLGEAMSRAEWPEGAECKRGQVIETLRDHPECCIVTEMDGRIVAFATWWPDRKKGFAEIGNNAVHPDFQGRGIGTMQCERLLAILRERGFRFARVGTGADPTHAPARRQYERVGFSLKVPSVVYYLEL